MPPTSLVVPRRDLSTMATILAAGTVVGVFDGACALLIQASITGAFAPVRLFQGIASGLLGTNAYRGGTATALLGVMLHFAFAHAWAAAFLVVYRHTSRLRRAIRTPGGVGAAALALGITIWLVMNFLVKPAGGMAPTPVGSGMFVLMTVVHVIAVGGPIVAIIRLGDRS